MDVYEAPKEEMPAIEVDENVNFETNSHDLQIQEVELEKQKQIENYRRRFEEALIRIEDQEDVEAMQGAKKEMRDDHEFDEMVLEEEGEEARLQKEQE